VLGVVALVFLAGFGYTYVQYNNETSQNHTLTTQLNAAQNNATSLAKELHQDVLNITALQASISADKTMIASLNSNVASQNATIASLNANITSLSGLRTQLQGQVGSLTTQIATLNSQIAGLQAAAALQVSKVVLTSQAFSESAGGCADVATIPVQGAGYLQIVVTSSSSVAYVATSAAGGCTSSALGQPFTIAYLAGTSGTFVLPFAASTGSVYVFTGNGETVNSVSTTLTITEYT